MQGHPVNLARFAFLDRTRSDPRSPEFRAKWGTHDVRRHATGTKSFIHPVVGHLDLLFEGAELMAEPD